MIGARRDGSHREVPGQRGRGAARRVRRERDGRSGRGVRRMAGRLRADSSPVAGGLTLPGSRSGRTVTRLLGKRLPGTHVPPRDVGSVAELARCARRAEHDHLRRLAVLRVERDLSYPAATVRGAASALLAGQTLPPVHCSHLTRLSLGEQPGDRGSLGWSLGESRSSSNDCFAPRGRRVPAELPDVRRGRRRRPSTEPRRSDHSLRTSPYSSRTFVPHRPGIPTNGACRLRGESAAYRRSESRASSVATLTTRESSVRDRERVR